MSRLLLIGLAMLIWVTPIQAQPVSPTYAELDRRVASAESPSRLAQALIARGETLRRNGVYGEALLDLSRAVAVAPEGAEREFALAALGIAQAEIGDAAAEATLRQAISGGIVSPQSALAAAQLSGIVLDRGEQAEALSLAEAALTVAAPSLVRAHLVAARGRAAWNTGRTAEARSDFAAANALLTAEPSSSTRSDIALALAQSILSLDPANPSLLPLAEMALSTAGAFDDRQAAIAADLDVAILIRRQALRQALERSATAMQLAVEANDDQLVFRTSRRRADIAQRLGRDSTALAAYRNAFARLRSIRVDLPLLYGSSGESLYRQAFEGFHIEFVTLLLELSEGGRTQALLREALDVVEDLKVVELEDYFRERCVRRVREDTIERVTGRTAVIYPILLPDRIELIVGIEGKLFRRTGVAGRAEVTRLVDRALQIMSTFEPGFTEAIVALYQATLEPAMPLLEDRGIERLVFVPDAALRRFPAAAFFDGERFLIERMEVATVLGLTLVEPRRTDLATARALVAGASSTSVEGFPPIPGVVEEAAAITPIIGAESRLDGSFSTTEAERVLQSEPFGIVHIAAHATFGERPEDNFIALSDGRLALPRVVRALRARSVQRDVPISLLTLSACQTAQGTEEAPLGLAGAAYRANVESVVASLWLVSDNVTPIFMERFYRALQAPGAGPARALAETQRSFLAGDEFERHPYIWGAFIAIGEWE